MKLKELRAAIAKLIGVDADRLDVTLTERDPLEADVDQHYTIDVRVKAEES